LYVADDQFGRLEGPYQAFRSDGDSAMPIGAAKSESRIITRQLLRSATSVAANYRAVCRSRSRAEFASKLGIVLEEADESLFWLELLLDSGVVEPDKIRPLLRETNELVSIFVASLRTVKGLKSEI